MSQFWEIMPAENRSKEAIRRLPQTELLDALETGIHTGEDFVRIDSGHSWLPIEDHPAFEEVFRQIEDSRHRPEGDETRLDMNPLIDVSLVLLIFFILTTSYAELRKEASPPPGKSENKDGKAVFSPKQLKEFTITVKAKMEGDRIRYMVENDAVPEAELKGKLEEWMKKTGKATLHIEIDPGVPFKAMIAIQDAAIGAGVQLMVRVDRKN